MRNLLQLVKVALVPQSKKEWTISLVTITVRKSFSDEEILYASFRSCCTAGL